MPYGGALDGVTAAYITYAPDLAIPGATDAIRVFTEQAVAQGVQRLILPGEMGETVKVMALASGAIEVPSGMRGRDMRSRL